MILGRRLLDVKVDLESASTLAHIIPHTYLSFCHDAFLSP